jgi:hypothetical protein
MPTTRGRLVAPNQVVFDQADFFQSDGYTRVLGLTVSQVAIQVYLNNVLQGWTLVDGSAVTEAQIVSGKVYFSPISGGPYSVRWRPNAIGYWRLILTYPAGSQILAQDYDVSTSTGTSGPSSSTGLQTSFIKPGGRDDC